ncbi:hypothetical protein D9V41_14045 [Aeromicrobium phragmitis]|uniref:DUF4064 domain-containing protein n=1 Tax=Aeromicrobium phragmitis TaxID=2478914 RepID=A0A3L8PI05_9ACTN|nr:hypothetical protein [Aeromicrobium phragmitis]RLV54935.1 hypothetical protein D9V41_14045 [Aeromicrobium phragmitis]
MAAPRPRSVTLACLYAGLGAAFLFTSLLSALWDWGSIALQDQIAAVIEEPPLAGFDLDVQTVLEGLRWVMLAGVVASIAGMVFAVFAFRGDRGSQIGLTVLCSIAALTFLGLGLVGLLPAMVAVACIALLWNAEARRFFSGEEQPLELGAAPAVRQQPSRPAQSTPPAAPTSGAPAPQPPRQLPPYLPPRRPTSVTLSLVLTGIGAALVAGFGVLALLVVTLGRAEYERTLNEQGLMQDVLRSSGISADDAIAIITWSAAAWVVLALVALAVTLWAATRRSPAARKALFAMSVVTLVVSVLFFPLGLLWTAAAVVVLVQVSKPDAKAWFSSS